MTWECDYPYSDATWPRSPAVLAGYLTDVPDDEVDRITHSNALRLYSFDMFKHLPKGELTVARFELRPRTSIWVSCHPNG